MIQREFLTLDIGALGKLDGGRVSTLFDAAMERVIDGIQDEDVERSGGYASGAIIITIKLAGRKVNEGGTINATVSISSAVPKPLCAHASLIADGGALAFDVTPSPQEELPLGKLRSVP